MKGFSKGQVLKELDKKLSGNGFKVPKLILILCSEWLRNKKEILELINKNFNGKKIALRSSTSDEDGFISSKAGEYESILNIDSSNLKDIEYGLEKIIKTYIKKGIIINNQNIIIQEMINNVSMSGVVFTKELNTGAPYYVINYDDISGLTNTVTSGEGYYSNRTLFIHRDSKKSLRSERFIILIDAIKEIEEFYNCEFLDIEFALDKELNPYLFQVRPITTKKNWDKKLVTSLNKQLKGIEIFIKDRFRPYKKIYGETTILGQMPDWNPAEMIGRAPRPLSFSLYSHLITESAWRDARKIMGYKSPVGQNLMVSLAGQPFIDTRLSLNSFLPNDLPDEISSKVVNFWLKRLKENPHLHDKVEFEIAITAFTFNIDERISNLIGNILNKNEKIIFRESYYKLTKPLIKNNGKASIKEALIRINKLDSIKLDKDSSDLNSLKKLLEDCINLGTIPFSILARHAFIAKSIMLSLVSRGIFTNNDLDKFQSGIKTVATELVSSISLLQNDEINKGFFMNRFGHLRPGTYDILSPRYDQIKNFASSIKNNKVFNKNDIFVLNDYQRKSIELILKEENMSDISVDNLLNYFSEAIKGREYGKFIFTKSVSSILELIANFGEKNNLNRECMSFIPLSKLLNLSQASIVDSHHDYLNKVAENHIQKHKITNAIRLPQLLFDEAGVSIIPFQVSQPNFVTNKKIISDIVYINSRIVDIELNDKIILIENADPGYDWIFSQRIAGLITKYGGANSHMSIRCAEFDIPAAIGCGEQRFESLLKSNKISLDCFSGLIQKLH